MEELRKLRRPANPLTRAATRRQILLQIYLPLGVTLLLIGVLVAVAVATAAGTVGSWADTTLTFLALPLALILGLVLAALAGAAVALGRLMQEIPGLAGGLQAGVDQAARAVRTGSQAATRPLMVPLAAAEAFGVALRSIRTLFRSPWDSKDG